MACACNGARAAQTTGNWYVTTNSGEKFGPFLTATEGRIKAQEQGGGVVKQLKA